MGYCFACGWYEPDLDPRTAMCRWCRDHWQPAGNRPGDLGYHGQPSKETA